MSGIIARFILRNRILLLIILFGAAAFFGYEASKIQLSYEYARVLPKDDQANIDYEKFKKLYGEDGNVLVLGFADKNFYELKKFNDWYDLTEKIKSIKGIKDVLSITRIQKLVRNDSLSKFDLTPIISKKPESQAELDSLKKDLLSWPFYSGLAYNPETGAQLMAVTFEKKDLDSKNRISIVEEIEANAEKFGNDNSLEIHYSGMPYIRTNYMKKVSSEMELFMILAVLVTAIILWLFFRSFNSVFYPLIVCILGVLFSLGTLQLFGYKITVLSGLIPPLIIVIGVPNCIFIINKYQEELVFHGNKIKALTRTLQKVLLSNFLANVTTAIGFGVFYFTDSSLLVEFGIVAAINVMTTFIAAHIFLPIIFSFLPKPSAKKTKHLQNKYINGALDWVDKIVHHHRKALYITLAVLTLISIYGTTKIRLIGHVVDDLPQKDPIYTHLKFFESNFHGVLPFEINIDTKKENGVFSDNGKTLYKIKALQKELENYSEFSKPVSSVEALKFAYQAYRDGNPKFYILPGSMELKKLSDYSSSVKGKENKLSSFIDSTKTFTRISYQMADVGSERMKALITEIKPKIDTIFNFDRETNTWADEKSKYNVMMTGHSLVFLKSNEYLYHHLFVSLMIAIGLILIIGIFLFRSVWIIVLSKLPCLIPLVMTAGIMGFLDINFKPSTILIFSIAFGIASDGTIYILTEYRHQLKKLPGLNRSKAISHTIRETGLSMIYTNIILFFGFLVFAASSFGGTVALGTLISITLLVSLATNLLLLPSILLSLEKRSITKEFLEEPILLIDEEEEEKENDTQ